MQTGEVIRKYRKQRNLTQEEMAQRLGVTAPAVNKWENGNSLPDITLLAPIARLLRVPLDELLSYREELTEKERQDLIRELGDRMKAEGYPKAFGWAEEILRQYPGDEELLLYMGVMLNAYRITEKPENPQQYDEAVCGFLSRALESPGRKSGCRRLRRCFSCISKKDSMSRRRSIWITFPSRIRNGSGCRRPSARRPAGRRRPGGFMRSFSILIIRW